MSDTFAAELGERLRLSQQPLRRVATQANIPHQTVFNWINGTHPRWYSGLRDDVSRLALALGLDSDETNDLLQLAGCLPAATMKRYTKDYAMQQPPQIPKHWFVAGSHPASYEIEVDPTVRFDSHPSAFIRSRDREDGFGTLMQQFQSTEYRGRRLRLAAMVRSAEVTGWAGLWLRVDGPQFGEVMAFDNMENRPVVGTTDWTPCQVVLDVADSSARIAFGLLLSGHGQVWMSDLRLEPVGADIDTTDRLSADGPLNLDFGD